MAIPRLAALILMQEAWSLSHNLWNQPEPQERSDFQTSNYAQAILIMDRVVPTQRSTRRRSGRWMPSPSKGVQQDPEFNSPELYKAMTELMVDGIHG
jgi:hypothetical protein